MLARTKCLVTFLTFMAKGKVSRGGSWRGSRKSSTSDAGMFYWGHRQPVDEVEVGRKGQTSGPDSFWGAGESGSRAQKLGEQRESV